MKKNVLLFAMLLGILGLAQAQDVPSSMIDINNVRGRVLGTGNAVSAANFNDLSWEVPKGSGNSSLFQYSLWVGAKDINDQLHIAAHRYNQVGRDYWMGPLRIFGGSIDEETEYEFEHIWNVTRAQIDDFIANHGSADYVIPEDILTWPAHGPEGYAENLAPFVDVNDDGLYNPLDGDYPNIPGDQCLFFIFNDNYSNHTETGGSALKLEVQAMVYAFDAPENEYINNTVFFHYDLINRSTRHYLSTYVGIWNDWDIGNGNDDYVGCDVRLGTCYGYNAEAMDDNYGDNPPVQLCILLAGPYMDADGIDNPGYSGDCDGLNNYNYVNFGNGIVNDERLGLSGFMVQSNGFDAMSDPTTAEEYFGIFKGRWLDGSKVMYGGDGYNMTVGPVCNFMFPGDSDPCNFGTNGVLPNGGYNVNGKYWTEMEAGNQPNDRRGLAVTGPFLFRPEASHPLDFAMTTVWKSDTQSALDRIEAAVEEVRNKFEDSDFLTVAENVSSHGDLLKVYPNPTEGAFTVEGTGRLTVVNALGQQMLTRDIDGQTTLNLPAGLYFVRVTNEKGYSVSKLLVK